MAQNHMTAKNIVFFPLLEFHGYMEQGKRMLERWNSLNSRLGSWSRFLGPYVLSIHTSKLIRLQRWWTEERQRIVDRIMQLDPDFFCINFAYYSHSIFDSLLVCPTNPK
jgi:hypothetical protein